MNLLKPDWPLYEGIVKLSTPSLISTLINVLKKKYKTVLVESQHEYVIAEGEIPVALVAHVDTVFPRTPSEIYYDQEKEIVWSPQGGIGDDRVGVFLIVKLLQQTKLRPYIFFMNDEEVGGDGATTLITDYPSCPWDIKFFIELDRHGEKDAVFYNCINEDFIDYICDFHFEEDFGIFSDISIICPEWKIAGVNLSVGYNNEHSILETWNVKHGYNTYTKVLNILTSKDFPFFEYNANISFEKCDGCGIISNDLVPVIDKKENKYKVFCPDCLIKRPNIQWCEECGEAFIGTKKNCRRCQDYYDLFNRQSAFSFED